MQRNIIVRTMSKIFEIILPFFDGTQPRLDQISFSID